MTEEQIVYENGNFWVAKITNGYYEVYENKITHAVRCGTIHFPTNNEKALNRAIAECDRRADLNN